MNQLLSIAESEHLLKKVIEDGDAPWGVLGLLIESVDHHNSWVVEYESFTEWMRVLAKKLDKKEVYKIDFPSANSNFQKKGNKESMKVDL